MTRKDRLNANEPKPPRPGDDFDQPPAELDNDPIAIGEWSRVVPMMRRIGLVAETERAALIAMCQQWSRYVDAHNNIRDRGMVIDGEKGPIVSPYIAVADKALTHCQKLWIEFGLTPSGRSRLSALPDTEPAKPSKWAGVV